MPSSTKLIVRPLHPTFTAEVEGVDWSKPIDDDTLSQIKDAIYKYGVLVFEIQVSMMSDILLSLDCLES